MTTRAHPSVQLVPAIRADDPLASAALRLAPRGPVTGAGGWSVHRPLGLRFLRPVPAPVQPACTYSHRDQVAVGLDGRPLLETMGKDWKTKGSSDGEEGPEEHYDWEEE